MQSLAQLLGFAMELFSESQRARSKNVEFVKETAPASKEDDVHELIPLGILARRLAFIKGGIERHDGGRHRQLASPSLHDSAGRGERRGEIGDESGSDLDALTGTRKFPFSVKGHCVIERDRENSVSVFPFANDGVEDAAFVIREAGTPILSYGVTRIRRLLLSSPEQRAHPLAGLYQRRKILSVC